ncbi:MAG: dihydroorotase, partial [Pseudomonadota bacterium]
ETIRNEDQATKSGWTPYDGETVKGWPIGTIIRGRRIMWDGEVIGAPQGAPVLFQESLKP